MTTKCSCFENYVTFAFVTQSGIQRSGVTRPKRLLLKATKKLPGTKTTCQDCTIVLGDRLLIPANRVWPILMQLDSQSAEKVYPWAGSHELLPRKRWKSVFLASENESEFSPRSIQSCFPLLQEAQLQEIPSDAVPSSTPNPSIIPRTALPFWG